MKFINVVLSLLISLAIGLGVFEGGLRLLGLGPPVTLNEFDADLGWSKTPSTTLMRGNAEGFEVEFTFNAAGLRDDAGVTTETLPSAYRVIALGDSFTLGFTVKRTDLFVDLLENWWNAEGRGVQIVNTGTEGYSTDQEVAWLETHGAAWEPDLVLLFTYENDIFWNGQSYYTDLPKPRYTTTGTREPGALAAPPARPWHQSTAIGHLFLSGPDESVELFQPGSVPLPKEMGALLTDRPDFMEEPLARTGGAMLALARKAESLNARVVVVPIPSHSAIHSEYREAFQTRMGLAADAWDPDQPVDLMLEAARSAGLDVLDVRPALKSAAADGEDLYFQTDWHLNPLGNRALARALHDGLANCPTLPAATTEAPLPDTTPTGSSLPGWLPWYAGLWLALGSLFARVYSKVEKPLAGFLKVGVMLAVVFSIALGASQLLTSLSPEMGRIVTLSAVVLILGFVAYKLGNRMDTIVELLKAFIGRGHWYLMPLVTVLLTVGSLLVVAASSPLVAPFIYTLF